MTFAPVRMKDSHILDVLQRDKPGLGRPAMRCHALPTTAHTELLEPVIHFLGEAPHQGKRRAPEHIEGVHAKY